MAKFYVTYGWGTALRDNFSVVEAPTYGEARVLISARIGNKFAFCYTEEQFEGQKERYGITEIPLQPHNVL